MENIRKIAFVTRIDDTNKKIIDKVVIFREGQRPLLEDYSKEKHMSLVVDKLVEEKRNDLKDNSIEYLRGIGFVEIANYENEKQMNDLRMEIFEDQIRFGDTNKKEKDTNLESLESEVLRLSETKERKRKVNTELSSTTDMKDFLNICRLREFDNMNEPARERLNSLLESSNKEILSIDRAYNEYVNSTGLERDNNRRKYIELRDEALKNLNKAEDEEKVKNTKIVFKETIGESAVDKDKENLEKYDLRISAALKAIAKEQEELARQKEEFANEKAMFLKQVKEALDKIAKEREELDKLKTSLPLEKEPETTVVEEKKETFDDLDYLKVYLRLVSFREFGALDKENSEALEAVLAYPNEKIHAIEEAYQKYINEDFANVEEKIRLKNEYISKRDEALREVNEALKEAGEKELILNFNIKNITVKDLDTERKRDSKVDELEKKISKRNRELIEYLDLNRKRVNDSLSKEEEARIKELVLSGNDDIDVLEAAYEDYSSKNINREVYDSFVKRYEDKVKVITDSISDEEIATWNPRKKELLESLLPRPEDVDMTYKGALQLLKAYSIFDENKVSVEYGDRLLGAISVLLNTPHKGEPIGSIVTGSVPSREELQKARESLTDLVSKVKDGDILTNPEKTLLLDDVYVLAGIKKGLFKDDEIVSRDTYTLRDPGYVDAKVDEKDKVKDEDKIDASLTVNPTESTISVDDDLAYDTDIEKKEENKEEVNTNVEVSTSKGKFTFRSCLGFLLGGVLAVTGIAYLWDVIKKAFHVGPRSSVRENVEHYQTIYTNQVNTGKTPTETPSPTRPVIVLENPNTKTRKNTLSLIKSFNYNLETTHFLESNEEFLRQFTDDAQFKNVCDALAFGYQMNTLMSIDNNFSLPVDRAKLQSFTNDFLCAKAVVNGYNANQMLTLFGRSNISYDELMTGYGNFLNMMTLYNTNAVKRPPVELLIDNPRDLNAVNSLYDSLININKSRKDGVVKSSETDQFIALAYRLYTGEQFSNEGVRTFGASLIDGYATMIANQGGLYIYKDTNGIPAGTHILSGTEGGLAFVRPDGGTYIIDRIVKSNVSPKAQSAQAYIRSNLDTYHSLVKNSDLPVYSTITNGIDNILRNKPENCIYNLINSMLNNRMDLASRARFDIETKAPVINNHPTNTVQPTVVPTARPTQVPTSQPPVVIERQTTTTTTVQKVEKEEMTPQEQAHVEKVEQLREQQLEAEKVRKDLLVSELANAYVRGEVTEAEVHARLKEYGIEEDPSFVPRLNEIKKNNAEVEKRTQEELDRLNNGSNIGYDPEMDPNYGMSDEAKFEAAFTGMVDSMTAQDLVGGKEKVLKRV